MRRAPKALRSRRKSSGYFSFNFFEEDLAGIGVDIVEIDRIAVSLERSSRFAPTVFSRVERANGDARKRPAEHLAACFAAKEAFLKALGFGFDCGVPLKEIEVRRKKTGEPFLRLGKRAQALLTEQGFRSTRVSLSHSRFSAIAVVLLQ